MEKTEAALAVIGEMEKAGEPVNVSEIARRAGVSRSFLHQNARVWEQIQKATRQTAGMPSKKKVMLDKALKKTVELQEKKIEKLKKENAALRARLDEKDMEYYISLR